MVSSRILFDVRRAHVQSQPYAISFTDCGSVNETNNQRRQENKHTIHPRFAQHKSTQHPEVHTCFSCLHSSTHTHRRAASCYKWWRDAVVGSRAARCAWRAAADESSGTRGDKVATSSWWNTRTMTQYIHTKCSPQRSADSYRRNLRPAYHAITTTSTTTVPVLAAGLLHK